MALSAQTYQGDGVNTDFVLDFTLGYISTNHIFVFVDEVEEPQNTLTFINGGGSVRLQTAPADGSQVLVRRIVPNDRLLHDYENGALVIEENLDESNKQAVMLQHESIDGFVSKGVGQDLNMSGLRIINLADAIDPGDAVNYQTLLQFEGQLQSTTSQGVAAIQQAETDALAAIAVDRQEVADNTLLVQTLSDDFETKYLGEVVALPSPVGRPEGQLAFLLGQGLRIIEQGAWSLAAAAPDAIFQAELESIGERVDDKPNGNLLINGGFDIWQRGTTNAEIDSKGFLADRWRGLGAAGITYNRVPVNNQNALSTYGLAMAFTSGSEAYLWQQIENAAKEMNLYDHTFSVTIGVTSGNPSDIVLEAINSTQNNILLTVPPVVSLVSGSVYKLTYTLPAFSFNANNGSDIGLRLKTSVIGLDCWFTDAKLERGLVATPFLPDDPHTSLAKCQRYYEVVTSSAGGYTVNNSSEQMWFKYAVTKRDQPTVTFLRDNEISGVGAKSVNQIDSSGHKVFFLSTITGSFYITSVYTIDAEL